MNSENILLKLSCFGKQIPASYDLGYKCYLPMGNGCIYSIIAFLLWQLSASQHVNTKLIKVRPWSEAIVCCCPATCAYESRTLYLAEASEAKSVFVFMEIQQYISFIKPFSAWCHASQNLCTHGVGALLKQDLKKDASLRPKTGGVLPSRPQ